MLNLFQHPQILKLVQDDILPSLDLSFASFSLYQDKENED